MPFWRSVHRTFFRYIVISSNSTLPIMKRNWNGISLFLKRKIAFFETENHWPYWCRSGTRSASQLSGSPFGWPRPAPRSTDACSQPDERICCSTPHTGCSSEVLSWESLWTSTFHSSCGKRGGTRCRLIPTWQWDGWTCRNVPVTYVLLK